MTNSVLILDAITEQALQALFSDEICVLQLKNFCNQTVADRLAAWFLNHQDLTPYHYVQQKKQNVKKIYFGVDRIGIPFNATYHDDNKKKQYYQNALPAIRAVREACFPYRSPVDQLRLELDEHWPFGANLAAFEGQKMFVGIGRVMKAELSHLSAREPHWDAVPTTKVKLRAQFSANIYLSVPGRGGELEIWPVPPIPTAIIHAQDPTRNWRAELPSSILIKPEQCDLLLFNTRRPHAITQFTEKERVAVQFFIGLTEQQNLVLWT